MSQKSILGVDFLQVSAGYNYKTHVGTKICDIVDKSFTKFAFRAPFDCEIVSIDGTHENTIVFQSKENVLIPARSAAVPICFRCSHMESSEYSSIITGVGQSFDQGEICYYAGGRSGTTDGHFTNHIHLEFAIGTFTGFEQLASGEGFVIKQMTVNTTDSNPHICFNEAAFIKPGTVVNINGGDDNPNYYVNRFVLTLTSGVSDTLLNFYSNKIGIPESPTSTGYYLNTTNQQVTIRTSVVNGQIVTTVPVGNSLEIIEFLGIQSDNYQWAKTKYGTNIGYSQIDTHGAYTISGSGQTIYLKTTRASVRLRAGYAGSSTYRIVPQGSQLKINRFETGFQSDGYQWVYGYYDGANGYAQLDTYNAYTIGF